VTVRKLAVVAGAAALVAALSVTHYWAFRQGEKEAAETVAPAVEELMSGEELTHLTFALEPLRLLAKHPEDLPPSEADAFRAEVERYVRVIEQKRLPELEKAGDPRAERHRKVTKEAKALLAQTRR